MGSLSISNGENNGCLENSIYSNGLIGKVQSEGDQLQRKSCWYEEEIEDNLRWSFALNRYIFYYLIHHFAT